MRRQRGCTGNKKRRRKNSRKKKGKRATSSRHWLRCNVLASRGRRSRRTIPPPIASPAPPLWEDQPLPPYADTPHKTADSQARPKACTKVTRPLDACSSDTSALCHTDGCTVAISGSSNPYQPSSSDCAHTGTCM